MVNFSANNLILVSTQTRKTFTRFIMRDQYTKRTYLLYDFEKSHQFERGIPYVVTGKINSANNQLFLVLETSRQDKKNAALKGL
jgi:hypothetical protein